MSAVICFVLGTMIGGTVGIFVMCLVQVNRLQKSDYERKEDEENEKDG